MDNPYDSPQPPNKRDVKRILLYCCLALCILGILICAAIFIINLRDKGPTEIKPRNDASVAVTTPATQPVTSAAATTAQPSTLAPTAAEETTLPEQPNTLDDDLRQAYIAQIQQWYAELMADTEVQAQGFTTEATVFHKNGVILSVAEYIPVGGDDPIYEMTQRFYYHDGVPYFALLTGVNAEGEETRLYFAEGQLIRWIEADGIVHDSDHPVWREFYETALTAFKNGTNAMLYADFY